MGPSSPLTSNRLYTPTKPYLFPQSQTLSSKPKAPKTLKILNPAPQPEAQEVGLACRGAPRRHGGQGQELAQGGVCRDWNLQGSQGLGFHWVYRFQGLGFHWV